MPVKFSIIDVYKNLLGLVLFKPTQAKNACKRGYKGDQQWLFN